MTKRIHYITPQCKVVHLDDEGFICTSGDKPDPSKQSLNVSYTPMTTSFGDSNRRTNDDDIW